MNPIKTPIRFLAGLTAGALLAATALSAAAQTASNAPKVIGQPQQPRLVPSMIVL